jgi:hypothetical protein
MNLKQAVRNKKAKKGFALVFVILIAAAMMIPILMLISSTIPRRTNVTGEAVSDRVLTVSDATIDNILNQINTFPFTFTASRMEGTSEADAATKAQDYLISYYISQLNGGVPLISDPTGSFASISGYASIYLYNLNTQEYYAVWDTANGHVDYARVGVGPDGDIAGSGTIRNLSTNTNFSLPFTNIDPKYKTDNLWAEIDTNTKYWPGDPDKWDIKTTAYLVSKPELKRTIEAVATRGEASPNADEYADGSWFTHVSGETPVPGHNFADYSGLYATKVYFGRFETTSGMIRSNQDIYMGGWAQGPVYAKGIVYDKAIDDGYKNDGRFGSTKEGLADAKADGNAKDGYAEAQFPNGDLALKGATPVRKPLTEDSLQDKAGDNYYVNGSATIVFSVEGGVGYVTINGNKLPIPANGAIFVEGNATVSGTVKGQCTVGAGGNINIGGNIVYNTSPRLDRGEPMPAYPDQLGLIAHGDILIPVATFNANHHLRIDAAMLAVTGNFGIGSGYTYHPIDGTGTYEAFWNGCQATYLTTNAPAMVSGNTVAGYDIQHTNYDYNLLDYGPPPFYPPTGTTTELPTPFDHYPIVTDTTLIGVDEYHPGILTSLTKSDLTPLDPSDPAYITGDMRYKFVYLGITYYYKDTFSWLGSAAMNKTALYRITWKEQISNPVKLVNP